MLNTIPTLFLQGMKFLLSFPNMSFATASNIALSSQLSSARDFVCRCVAGNKTLV